MVICRGKQDVECIELEISKGELIEGVYWVIGNMTLESKVKTQNHQLNP